MSEMIDALAASLPLRLAALIAVFLIVSAVVIVVSNLVVQQGALRRRVADIAGAPAAAYAPVPQTSDLREKDQQTAWVALANAVEKAGISLDDTKADQLRRLMLMAGYRSPSAPRIYTLARIILLILFPSIFMGVVLTKPVPPSVTTLYVGGVLTALVGLYFPRLWVQARADRRKTDIINGFPDCLDLMLVCIEAGLGLEAAFDRVGREVMRSHPLLAEMLSVVTFELRAGANREDALRAMADRSQVDEIRAFSTLLIQSDRLGSSIGTTLRVYAAEMREKRQMRAEEKAHKLPVIISIPLVVCMLPTMIGVIMLPAVLRVVYVIFPLMNGQH